MNLLPGAKVAVRRGNDFFEGTVTRTEIVDGEQYVIGEWVRKIKGPQGTLRYDKFRAHIDDMRLWWADRDVIERFAGFRIGIGKMPYRE